MSMDDVPSDIEAKPEPAPVPGPGLPGAVEDRSHSLGGDPHSSVADGDVCSPLLRSHSDNNSTARRCELDRVGQEVAKALRHPAFVTQHEDRLRSVEDQSESSLFSDEAQVAGDIADERCQILLRKHDRKRARLDGRRIEQITNEGIHPSDRALD